MRRLPLLFRVALKARPSVLVVLGVATGLLCLVPVVLTVGGGGGDAARPATGRASRDVRPPLQIPAFAPATPRTGPVDHHATPRRVLRDFDHLRFVPGSRTLVRRSWVRPFKSLYRISARANGVSWLLLASIHRQETAFSTSRTTYHGLNFARCCGGPMQFNVTNGPVTTWARVRMSYKLAHRPRHYNFRARRHPSLYDDFDAIMAAGHLLAMDGATTSLDGSAWRAAYDYYGHDTYGVTYADEVLARAQMWARQGFCINCAVDPDLVAEAEDTYGAPIRAQLEREARRKARERARARHRRERARERRRRARRRAAHRRALAAARHRRAAAPPAPPHPRAKSGRPSHPSAPAKRTAPARRPTRPAARKKRPAGPEADAPATTTSTTATTETTAAPPPSSGNVVTKLLGGN